METRYVRLNYEQALSAKKELLSSELNSLAIAKKIREYKSLRRKEFILKKKLKTALSSLRIKTSLILANFPREDLKITKPKSKQRKKEKGPEIGLHNELEEIKKKLAKLG